MHMDTELSLGKQVSVVTVQVPLDCTSIKVIPKTVSVKPLTLEELKSAL